MTLSLVLEKQEESLCMCAVLAVQASVKPRDHWGRILLLWQWYGWMFPTHGEHWTLAFASSCGSANCPPLTFASTLFLFRGAVFHATTTAGWS